MYFLAFHVCFKLHFQIATVFVIPLTNVRFKLMHFQCICDPCLLAGKWSGWANILVTIFTSIALLLQEHLTSGTLSSDCDINVSMTRARAQDCAYSVIAIINYAKYEFILE